MSGPGTIPARRTPPGTVTVEYDEIRRWAKLSATGLTDAAYAYDNNSP
ncbi:MAG: hypothetical protein U0231_04560 [Nitrospiraceae bacterium]